MPKRAVPRPLRPNRQPHSTPGQRRWSLRGSPAQRAAIRAPVPSARLAVWACAWPPPWFRSNRSALCRWCPLSHNLPRCPVSCVARSTWHQQTPAQGPAGWMGLLGKGLGGPRPRGPLGGTGAVFPLMLLWPWPGTASEPRRWGCGGPKPAPGVRTAASSPEPPPVARSLPSPLGPSAAWSSPLKAQKGLSPGVGLVCPPESPSLLGPFRPHSADPMPLKGRRTPAEARGCDQDQSAARGQGWSSASGVPAPRSPAASQPLAPRLP